MKSHFIFDLMGITNCGLRKNGLGMISTPNQLDDKRVFLGALYC